MTILLARIQEHQVEVLNVWTSAGRKVASVQALRGEPFCEWTHGGYCYSRSAVIPAALLTDFVEVPELTECGCVLPEQTCSACNIPQPAPAEIYLEDL